MDVNHLPTRQRMVVLPAADRAALRTSALATWDTLAKETGGDAVAYRQRILDALPK